MEEKIQEVEVSTGPEPSPPEWTGQPHAGLNIYQRIRGAQSEIAAIPKLKKSDPKTGGYAFAGVDDIITAVRPALNRWGVYVSFDSVKHETVNGSRASGNPFVIDHVWVVGRFVNTDRPADRIVTESMLARGTGSGDTAIGVAMSYATKVLLRTHLLLACGEDAETAGHGDYTFDRPAPAKKFAKPAPAPPVDPTSQWRQTMREKIREAAQRLYPADWAAQVSTLCGGRKIADMPTEDIERVLIVLKEALEFAQAAPVVKAAPTETPKATLF